MSVTGLQFGRDSHSYNAFAPYPSTVIYNVYASDGNATSIIVPSTGNTGFWCVSYRYQPGSTWFVDVTGATAAIPVNTTLASATAEMIPASHTLLSGTNISVITPNVNAYLGIVMWQIGQS